MWRIETGRFVCDESPELCLDFASIKRAFIRENGKDESLLDTLIEDTGARLSKLSGDIEFFIECDEKKGLCLGALAKRGLKQQLIQFSVANPVDYVIFDKDVVYLDIDVGRICLLLAASEILGTGPITLRQYLELLKCLQDYPDIKFKNNSTDEISNYAFAYDVEPNVNANLRPYQLDGFRWLSFMVSQGLGCVLADGMGLGKTLQSISLIEHRHSLGLGPVLVIAPVSLMENWRREIKKFAPNLLAAIHHGPCRTGFASTLTDYDVTITAYGTAVSDSGMLSNISWDMVLLDEAQAIKNPDSKRTRAIKRINARSHIAISGTPFESHLKNIWSIVDFCLPGYLGNLKDFNNRYGDDVEGAHALEPRLTPLMLRRVLADVNIQLPERIDSQQILSMTTDEAQGYEDVRARIIEGLGNSNVTLSTLSKLRMYCAHPFLLKGSLDGDPYAFSAKYQRACELIACAAANNEKTILFTSYLGMLAIFKEDIPVRVGIPVFCIDGSVPAAHRQSIVDEFSKCQGPGLLVTNTKTGGCGLNITAANHVIHYNLEWNPAEEDQASARAHRSGQKNTVFVYELSYASTVEEHIIALNDKKRAMDKAAVIGVDGSKISPDDIMRALSISPLNGDYQ